MANDHYISRFLTQPWEGPPQRSLRYYDCVARKFGSLSSRKLFAAPDLNDPETELRLNQWIETPVSQYLNGARSPHQYIVLGEPQTWIASRALACLWFLQMPR